MTETFANDAATPLPLRKVRVFDKTMAYTQLGEASADNRDVVFLHGNPTSSYLWRNVMRPLAGLGRLIAPDLIGMGASDKLDGEGAGRYRVVEHRRWLDGFLDAIGLRSGAVLVLHDWGSALGFDRFARLPATIGGIAYMEAIVAPVPAWSDWPKSARGMFQALRSDAGEDLILKNNIFVERILPSSIMRDLTDAEMTEYRRPFALSEASRWPTLDFPRDIPIEGEPADMVAMVANYAQILAASPVPKLFINADPGAILIGAMRDFCRTWRNQREATVKGSHFIQEDSPAAIAEALAAFLASLDARAGTGHDAD